MVVIAALAVSCGLEDIDYNNSDNVTSGGSSSEDTEIGTGYLSFSSLELLVDLESEDFNTTKSDDTNSDDANSDDTIDTDGYFVTITNEDPDSEQESITMTFAEIKALSDGVELLAGNYTLSARSYETQIEALGWDTPEYASKDYSFVIAESEVSEFVDDVICTLANIKATVALSEELLSKFKSEDLEADDLPLTVIVEFGGIEAIYTLDENGDLVGDGDVAYFAEQEDNTTMTLSLSGMYNTAAEGETAEYVAISWSQEIEDVAAGQYRNITISVSSETPDVESGTVSFEVSTSSTVESTDVEVDITNGDFYEKGEAELNEGTTEEENEDKEEENDSTSIATCTIEWRDGEDGTIYYLADETSDGVRYEISTTTTLPVVIDMTSQTGITSLNLQINSDTLTEEELAGINLSQNMDLVNPATPEMEGVLNEFGFPTGDDITTCLNEESGEYEPRKELVLDITIFMPLLAAISDSGSMTDFVVTLGDASGTCTKTIMVIVEGE